MYVLVIVLHEENVRSRRAKMEGQNLVLCEGECDIVQAQVSECAWSNNLDFWAPTGFHLGEIGLKEWKGSADVTMMVSWRCAPCDIVLIGVHWFRIGF